MPFQSKAQQAYLFANHPEVAKEFASHMMKEQYKDLPKKKKKKDMDEMVKRAKEKYGK